MSKDFSKSALAYLKDKKLFGPYAKYVCNLCLDYASNQLNRNDTNEVPGEDQVVADNNVENLV